VNTHKKLFFETSSKALCKMPQHMEDKYVGEGTTTTPFCSWISANRSHKTNGVLFQTKDIVLVTSPSDKIQLNSSVRQEACTWITKRRGGL